MSLWPSKKYDDLTTLVRACQKQDARAQTALYERYKSRLLGTCVRYARSRAEAEDIFQESFLKVFANIGEVRQPESIDGWVKSVVVRTAINYYHRTTRHELKSAPLDDSNYELENNEYEKIIGQIHIDTLLGLINQLPDGYRVIINLYLIDGYTHAEIAALLSIAESTSRSQYMRGRNLLVTHLKALGITHYEIY